MINETPIPVKVAKIEKLTSTIKKFTLIKKEGGTLPPFSPGSHIQLTMRDGSNSYKNLYSLTNFSYAPEHYEIAVKKIESSREGSAYLHTQVMIGMELEISLPINLFPMCLTARKHILIAGGIGITPFISYLEYFKKANLEFELHYAIRQRDDGAFVDFLEERWGKNLRMYLSGQSNHLNPAQILSQQPLGSHLYVCGPTRLLNTMLDSAYQLGWPKSAIHFERFIAEKNGNPFIAVLSQSQKDIIVPENLSLMEALENAGINLPNSCRGGACGSCEIEVLAGEVEHRDYFLNDQEKNSHKCMMPCVSRAKGEKIVLNL